MKRAPRLGIQGIPGSEQLENLEAKTDIKQTVYHAKCKSPNHLEAYTTYHLEARFLSVADDCVDLVLPEISAQHCGWVIALIRPPDMSACEKNIAWRNPPKSENISGQFKKKKMSNQIGVRFGAQPHPFYFCEHHTGDSKKKQKKRLSSFWWPDIFFKKLNSLNWYPPNHSYHISDSIHVWYIYLHLP